MKDTEMKIGNAPCSWGVFYPTGNTLTAEGYLDAVAQTGYEFTELGPLGFLGEDPVWINQALAERGLTMAGAAHVHTLADPSTAEHLTQTLHRLGRLLAKTGARDLILMDESEWYPPEAQGKVDADGWHSVIGMIRNADQLLRQNYGITLHIHPHVGTCIEREDQIDRLLAETDVSVCFDTGHHAFWDQDVLTYMEKIWDRIGFMHLKNVDPLVRAQVLCGKLGVNLSFDHGVMCSLQTGAVDIAAVVRLLVAKGFDGFCIVEQDPSKNAAVSPEALATSNLTYLTAILRATNGG